MDNRRFAPTGGLEHVGARRRRSASAGRTTRALLAIAALAVVAAVAVVGCGGEGGDDAPTRLEATEFEFSPSEVTVERGEHEFQIVNRGDVEHALEIHTPAGEVETERVAPGESATVTADLSEAGTYELYCPVGDHRQRGMTGTVTVDEAAGGDDRAPAY
ncbi:MAG: cupredoxin domain-containing protein [Actinobacteria bacterium]|nr:cupredoxin domain-containing protein [Actinomycetota bacterium]